MRTAKLALAGILFVGLLAASPAWADTKLPRRGDGGISQDTADGLYGSLASESSWSGTQDFTGSTHLSDNTTAVTTADQGYAVFPFITFIQQAGASAQVVNTTDKMSALQVVLPFQLTVSDVITYVRTAGTATARFGCGLYAMDGTKVLESGAIDASSTGRKKVTLGSPVTVNAGKYWFGWTANQTAIRILGCAISSFSAPLFDDTVPKFGKSSNDGSDGVMPATLGTITYEFVVTPPIVLMQP